MYFDHNSMTLLDAHVLGYFIYIYIVTNGFLLTHPKIQCGEFFFFYSQNSCCKNFTISF